MNVKLAHQNGMNPSQWRRQLSPGSNWQSNLNLAVTIIVAGLLLVLAGFSIVEFLLNFDQLQQLAEENGGANEVGSLSPDESSDVEGADLSGPASATTPMKSAAWLVSVNRYRAMAGLAPLTADPELSRGDVLHSRYLATNYGSLGRDLRLGANAHTEDSGKPEFTAEGAAAAAVSDVDWMWDPLGHRDTSWAIDDWMEAPFHRMQILNPRLRKAGYGTDCQGAACFAALNTGSDVEGLDEIPKAWSKPLLFPPDGSVMDADEFSGEWPNPLASCPGYASPAGLPVTLELGHLLVPGFSNYSIRKIGIETPLEACAFDANTYVNPDQVAQTAARAVLRDFGAIIIVPRLPLSAGRYEVSVTAGQTYSWSFSVERNP
jgi:hypothetical protein